MKVGNCTTSTKMRFFGASGLKLITNMKFLKPTGHLRLSRCWAHSLKSRIQLCGPISVADFMKEVLTHPNHGYYVHKDVFGADGDFITSPEISQLFGEMVAVWILNEWTKIGSPQPFQLIELGPGRGTMMKDILRVFEKLGVSKNVLEVHLVEVSEELSKIQATNLCAEVSRSSSSGKSACYQTGATKQGVPVYWYRSATHLPKMFSVVVAHEFFDALPIHKFQKTPTGWREVLVDVDPKVDGKLRLVLSEVPTPASILLVKKEEKREHIEVSPLSGVLMGHLAERLESQGGFALVADYGHFGDKEDTFRAFRKHQLHDPLVDPGTADLTADVDFSYLKEAVGDKLVSFGPVPQHEFLKRMHIDVRLKKLTEFASKEEGDKIMSGYHMIMDESGMGKAFKFMSFFPAVLAELLKIRPPAGFHG